MADKNKNGIPDNLELPGFKQQSLTMPKVIQPAPKAVPKAPAKKPSGLFQGLQAQQGQGLSAPQFQGITAQQFQGVTNPIFSGLSNLFSGIFGQRAAPAPKAPTSSGRSLADMLPAGQQQDTGPAAPKTLSDYLAEFMPMFGGGAGGGLQRVDYSAERNAAQQKYGQADARLAAMYRQPGDSIAADAPGLQQAYQGAIDTTKQNAADATAATQAAQQAADAHNSQVLGNLGIQQAQGNIIQGGQDLGTQAAGAIARQQSKAQAAADLLANNQATALANNTNVKNAAGLEGNMQRAQGQQKLADLLAQINMKEGQDNASIANSQVSAQNNALSQALQFAKSMYEADQGQQSASDLNAYRAQQLALKQKSTSAQGFNDFVKNGGFKLPDPTSDPQGYANMLNALRSIYSLG